MKRCRILIPYDVSYMNDIVIHELLSDQVQLYQSFLTVGLLNDEENFRITPNDELGAPFPTNDKEDSFTLGAFCQKNLCGVISFEREGSKREKLRHKGTLFRVYVARDFRGKGIAKKLIESVLERVREVSGIEQINLTVIANNEHAKTLYESFGFGTYGSEENAIKWNNKYFREDYMSLQLTHHE